MCGLAVVRQVLSVPSNWVSPGPAALLAHAVCLLWFGLSLWPYSTHLPCFSDDSHLPHLLLPLLLSFLACSHKCPDLPGETLTAWRQVCANYTGPAGEVGHEPGWLASYPCVRRDTCPVGCSSWCWIPEHCLPVLKKCSLFPGDDRELSRELLV